MYFFKNIRLYSLYCETSLSSTLSIYIAQIAIVLIKGLLCCFFMQLLILIYSMMGLLIFKYQSIWQEVSVQFPIQTIQNDRTYSMIRYLPESEQYFYLQNNKQNNYHSIFLNVQNDKNDTCKVQTLKSAPIQFVRIVALRATSVWDVSYENRMKHAFFF